MAGTNKKTDKGEEDGRERGMTMVTTTWISRGKEDKVNHPHGAARGRREG